MKKDPLLYLGHMDDRAVQIAAYILGVTKSEFLGNRQLQDAVVRNLEILGEAAKRLTEETRGLDASVPWKFICGLRDVLVHDYAYIDMKIVWTIATRDVPKLRRQIVGLVKKIESGSVK